MTMNMWMTRPIGRGKLYTESPPQQLLPQTAVNAMRLVSAQFLSSPSSTWLQMEFWKTWQVCQRSQACSVCRADHV